MEDVPERNCLRVMLISEAIQVAVQVSKVGLALKNGVLVLYLCTF